MADPPLTPADPAELVQALAHALLFKGRRRVDTAAEMTARIAAEHLVEALRQGRFIVMKLPAPTLGPDPYAASGFGKPDRPE